jgi:simple sugar transport system ATP-binding protein
MADAPLLSVRGASKRFGGVQALQRVSFDLHAGEVLALAGDNGAGKSTLIKCISGVHAPDEGEILYKGRQVLLASPREARALGIETIYQDLALADNLDVPSNLFLGRELMRRGARGWLLDLGRMSEEARRLLGRLRIDLPNLRQRLRDMSGGQRQCVAIARSVYFNARLVILDEPTAALGVKETERVMALVAQMREHGLAVVMISHNLNHVFDLCDRITVLKTGRVAGSRRVAETTREEIVRLILTGGAACEGTPAAARPVAMTA